MKTAVIAPRSPTHWWLIAIGLLLTAVFLPTLPRLTTTAQTPPLTPTFSHPAGRYDSSQTLRLSVADSNAAIFYTQNGRLPTPSTAIYYAQPIQLNSSQPHIQTIRARAFLPDGTAGETVSASYLLGMETSLPVLSLIVAPDDFWSKETGIYVNHVWKGREAERPLHLTYSDPSNQIEVDTNAGVRIHGGWTRYFLDKKSLRLYFRGEYGDRMLNAPIFGEGGQQAFDTLVLHNSGQDLKLLRNTLIDRLTTEMGGYATRSQPVLVFINGRSWGIYTLREQIDPLFLQANLGIPAADISDTPNNRGQQSEQQLAVDTVHWEKLVAFVTENDLSHPDNYAYLQSQLDLPNFVNYYILQMWAANVDWPHHNVHQFRPRTPGGRWEWIVWDNDFAFDLVTHQMVDHVLIGGHPLGERSVLFWNKLLENPDFYNLFATRTADLLNTTLAPANVSRHIDELAAELTPDIGYEISRWSIPTSWETAVAEMHQFAQERPERMLQHMVESLPLEGVAQLTIQTVEGEGGMVAVNGLAPTLLPWQGQYFVGTEVVLTAVPPEGSEFVGWEGDVSGTANPLRMQITGDLVMVPRFTAVSAP
ncbi:MAG: CotH kinase family protein [Chloroflexota bacterium]